MAGARAAARRCLRAEPRTHAHLLGQGFCRNARGRHVRLLIVLVQELAPTMSRWAELVAPLCRERCKARRAPSQRVASASTAPVGLTGRLSIVPASRYAGGRSRCLLRRRRFDRCRSRRSRPMPAATAALANDPQTRLLRPLLRPIRWKRNGGQRRPQFQAGSPAKIAAMRAAGHDPTATPAAQQRRVRTQPPTNAKPWPRGVMMDLSMAWIFGAIFCRSCSACRCA